ncbi:hypothetical protein IWQ62_005101, partial [Dispira parvispora]
MAEAGINTNLFSPHTIRSASATKAKLLGFTEDVILRAANWANAQTFYKFYYQPPIERTALPV